MTSHTKENLGLHTTDVLVLALLVAKTLQQINIFTIMKYDKQT